MMTKKLITAMMINPQAKGNVKHEVLLNFDEKNDAQTPTVHKVGNTKDGYTGTSRSCVATLYMYTRHVLQKKVRRGYVPTHVAIDALVDVVNVIDFFKAKKKDGLLRGTAKGYKSTISSFYLSHFPNAGKNWDDAANTWNPAFHPTVVDIVNSLPIKKEKG